MAVGNYGSFVCSRMQYIRDKQNRKLYKASKFSPQRCSLEEEIFQLRRIMENTALQEQSLTSDLVVQISRILDHKINEYMRHNCKRAGRF